MLPRWLQSARHLQRLPEVWRCSRRVHDWWRTTRAYLRLGEPGYPFEFATHTGIRLQVNDFHELVTAWIIWCREEYRVPTAARVILDLGANYGAFTLLAASQAPQARIVSLEPFPPMYQRLAENVTRHRFQDRVTCWPLALAAANGTRRLEVDPACGAPSNFGLLPAETVNGHVAIDVRTLGWPDVRQRLRDELGTDQIDLVKMDIESAEHEVLPELTPEQLAGIRAWQMEYHPGGPKQRLFAALARGGLTCVRDLVIDQDCGVAHFERLAD